MIVKFVIKSFCGYGVLTLILVFMFQISSFAQYYAAELAKHREHYKSEFLTDENSPLKQNDLEYLRFYAANPGYIVNTSFTRINDSIGFDMHTHNGVIKKYFVYGYVTFRLKNTDCKLYIYQSQKLMTKKGFEDYLFIPFTDETNYKETFGGGRYLDFKMSDIFKDKLIIDFNKAYNPYCAFKEGYACPIPPKENDLKISIEAGEKLFGKE